MDGSKTEIPNHAIYHHRAGTQESQTDKDTH